MFKIHISIERWKFNKDFSVYVSSWGNIKDINKNPMPVYAKNKYLAVVLNKKIIYVHRLVLETFKPEGKDLTVDHIDHNQRNNHLSNLRWLTKAENENDNNREKVLEECRLAQCSEYETLLYNYSTLFKQSAQENSGCFTIEYGDKSFVVSRKKARDFAETTGQSASKLSKIKGHPFKPKRCGDFTYTWYPCYKSYLMAVEKGKD